MDDLTEDEINKLRDMFANKTEDEQREMIGKALDKYQAKHNRSAQWWEEFVTSVNKAMKEK